MATRTPGDGGTTPSTDPLEELIFECLDRLEDEGPGALDALCAEHPERAEALRERIGALGAVGLIAGEGDRFPERLGEFRLLECLGAGGMGVVYRAEQTSLGREVALKLIRPEHLFFPGARERFRREVHAVARLAHPNIASIHTVGEEDGVPYFAMELVGGASLADVLSELEGRTPAELRGRDLRDAVRRLSRAPGEDGEDDRGSPVFRGTWTQACLRLVRQVADALEHAHRRGVLHRDVKPSNVMITTSGRALLLDFGLASLAGESRLTRSGSHLGSLPYLSPGRVRGESSGSGVRDDVYALGVTLYELLSLRLPFESDGVEALLRDIETGRPQALRARNPEVSQDAETVCATAMELEPERRYASADAFSRDLSNVLEHRPIEARRAGPLLHARRWARRHPGWAAAVLLGALVAVAGPSVFAIQERRASREIAAERDLADAGLRDALDALDLLTDIAEHRLADVPEAADARRELLEGVLEFQLGLLARRRALPGQERAAAAAQYRVGNIRVQLGDLEGGEGELRDAIASFEELLRSGERTSDAVRDLGLAHRRLGTLLRGRGDYAGAETEVLRALELAREFGDAPASSPAERYQVALSLDEHGKLLLEQRELDRAEVRLLEAIGRLSALAEELPDEPEFRESLAMSLHDLASARIAGRRMEEALTANERALSVLRGLLADFGSDPYRELRLVVALGSEGRILQELGRPAADAVACYEEAVVLGTTLVEAHARVPAYRQNLLDVTNNLGVLHWGGGRLADARPLLESAVRLSERLVLDHPDTLVYRSRLASFRANLAGLLGEMGELDAAGAELQRGIEEMRAVLADHPGDANSEVAYNDLRINLAATYLRQGRHADAALNARSLGEPDGWEYRRQQALILAWCARLADADESLAEPDRGVLLARYQTEAAEILSAARAAGLPEPGDLEESPDWAELRARPDLRALLGG